MMNTEMHGKQIKKFLPNDAPVKIAEGQITFMLSATYHGDRDEFWIIVFDDMQEVARHNCKYVESIEWA